MAGVLEMGRTDPAGKPHGPTAHVFGNEVGEPIKSPKTAWRATCRRAGIADLRFHDLRHEAGSRYLEHGWPVHHVRDLLGHANLATTNRYLNVTTSDLLASNASDRQSAKRLQGRCKFGPKRPTAILQRRRRER